MEAAERRNMACNALGESLWGLGWGLATPLTVLPLLVRRMGGGEVEVGLIATASTACVLLPQVLSSLLLQRGEGKKRLLLIYHLAVMVPLWAGLGLAALLASSHPGAARALIQILFVAFMLGMGFISPVWLDWVAGLFRREVRGTAFGSAGAASAMGGVAAALLAGEIASRLDFPYGYSVLFFVGSGFYVLSMLAFLPVRQRSGPPGWRRLPGREILARFRTSLGMKNFRRYLVSRVLLTAGTGPVAFFAVHYEGPEGGEVAAEAVIRLGAAIACGQAVAGFALGRFGDAFGHKAGAAAGASAQLVSILAAAALTGPWGCGLVFALTGVAIAGGWVSHQNMILETCPHDCRMAHITASNLVLAPVTALVPIITGKVVSVLGTGRTFWLCLVPTALGLAWLLAAVREPRTIPVAGSRTIRGNSRAAGPDGSAPGGATADD